MTNPSPEPVPIAKLSNLRMAAGNEKKYTYVIHNGILKHWVAIGWIDATDRKTQYDLTATRKEATHVAA